MMMPLLSDWDFDVLITDIASRCQSQRRRHVDLAASRRIAVLNAAPYASGVLAKGSTAYPRYAYQDASEEMLDPIRKIEAICTLHRVPPERPRCSLHARPPDRFDDLRRDQAGAGRADGQLARFPSPKRHGPS